MEQMGQHPFPEPEYCPPDFPITFVTSEAQGNVHLFVPEAFEEEFVKDIAKNFSKRIQEPVTVFHDSLRLKFRLCPTPEGFQENHDYGTPLFLCDLSDPPEQAMALESREIEEGQELPEQQHIPRPPNSWILYRQSKSKELSQENSGMTASELSTVIARMWHSAPPEEREIWQAKAKEEERIHKEMYPGYKYSTKKSSGKATKSSA